MPSSPLKDSPARVVAAVVEVATAASPSTPTSVALCRKAAARRFGTPASSRRWREAGARWRLRTALPQRVAVGGVLDPDPVGVGPGHLVLAVLRRPRCAAPTIGEQASMRSARPMIAEPLVSFRKGIATFGSSWRSSKFGASKTCRLWLE